ncbi:hypothetical protein FSP39_012511 [Pinctada imbricata]|uniref:CS domain-containing protein n=1 Tax=Pinctada imbricata TaxID=66713 RepID=A0AA88XRT1_PINIB|nr:hypothetical protein FSP39_012511 [Pinctada imbricata]
MATNVITPSYACDEKKKDGFVRVIVGIRNLTTTRKGIKLVKKPDNAEVNVTFEESSLSLIVTGKQKGELKGKTFELKIKKLPHEINSTKSYYEVDEDRVLLFLKKNEDKSWYPELESGLETAEEEEEDQGGGKG